MGCVSYENFFTDQELQDIENHVLKTEKLCEDDVYLPNTAQQTFCGKRLTRTKFFFGYRYMWTKCQLSEPLANVAAGV